MQKKTMKLAKKITIVLMITILFLANLSIFMPGQKVQALTKLVNQAELFSEGEVVYFYYDGIGIGVEVTMYRCNGIKYPVYCLNKGKPGVTQDHGYTVKVESLLSDMKVWRAIKNGYPFKSLNDLGCKTAHEAYAATKMAIYDTMYHYDLDKFVPHDPSNQTHVRTVNAIKKIITAARNSTETKVQAVAKIKSKNEEWKVEENNENYVSKTYSLETSASNLTYEVSLEGVEKDVVLLTDINGRKKTSFKGGEEFKIQIPIKDLGKGGNFTIHVETDIKTFPVFFGETPNPDWQNFAIIMGYYENTTASLKETYYQNKTEIQIYKQDGDTKKPLKNAKFQLVDENNKIVFSEVTTDKEGKASLQDLIPGTYFLKEVQTPEGYYGYDKEIKVQVKLNEKCMITIDNFSLPKEEYEPKPQEEKHISASERKVIKTLPRTGC